MPCYTSRRLASGCLAQPARAQPARAHPVPGLSAPGLSTPSFYRGVVGWVLGFQGFMVVGFKGPTPTFPAPRFSKEPIIYRSGNKYADLKLRMGPSESRCQSSSVPKNCGRASGVWSGARSARLTLGNRAHRVAFGCPAHLKKSRSRIAFQKKRARPGGIRGAGNPSPSPHPGDSRLLRRVPKKLGAGWRQGDRAGECPGRTQAVGLKEWWAGLQLAKRASEFTAAGRRSGFPNELHPKFELAKPMTGCKISA
jgi:hypothetical protein